MAGLSPSRRKRNDFTDFFRTSTSSAPSQKDLGAHELQPTAVSESEQDASGGYLSPPEGSKTIKRVATKIPFLGRSRKKSTHSVKSGVVSDATSAGYESTDFGESSTAALKKSRRFSQPASSPEHSSTAQGAPSSLFFPTKLAAHFQITKSKKPRKGSTKDGQSLAVPSEPRPVSFDSDTSESSAVRSATPRPTITLSPSPDGPLDDIDNLDEFDDLFTRSKLPKKPTSSIRETCTPASAYRDMFHNGDSSVTLTPARRNTTHVSSLSPAETVSDIARREARELAERTSKSKLPNTLSSILSQAEANEDSAETGSVVDAASSASLVNRTRSLSPASLRAARLRTKSAATTKMASKPPNIPLPLPPAPKTKPPSPPVNTPPAVEKPLPLSPSRTSSRHSTNSSSPGRRRAHTDGSLPPSLIKREAAIKSASKPSTPESEKKASSRSSADKENIDVDSLTPEQMKEALVKRIRRVEELEDQMAELARAHASEKTTLEKRIRVLELDVHKRTNENRALVRVLQTRVDKSKSSETDTASISSTKYSRMIASGSPPSRHTLSNPDDSGVESCATSGAESALHGSTSIRKKAQRPLILSDSLYRSSLPSAKVPTKRESLYSLTSTSATSSASSLLPPSPSLGGSPLSAILESPNATSQTSSTITKKRTAPIIAGESLSDDDRRLSRISRFSTSSSASSSSLSTTATSAYSANLRRGRPPSIAQVLEKGGVDERFDKIQIVGVTQAIATPYTQ